MNISKKVGVHIFLIVFLIMIVSAQEPLREDLNKQIEKEPTSFGVNVKQEGVDLFTGDAKFDIPLVNLPGRNGLDLSVSLSYSSNIEPYRENKYAPSSWVGLGWSLGFGSITVDHQNTEEPFDDKYYFNGQRLLPQMYANGTKFITEIYDFKDIKRVFGDPPNSIIVTSWEVTDVDGTKYIYGYADSNGECSDEADGLGPDYDAVSIEIVKRGNPAYAGYVANDDGDYYVPIKWKLKKIIDSTGNNEITFCYEKDSEYIRKSAGTCPVTADCSAYRYTRASYPLKIIDSVGRTVEFGLGTRNQNEYYDPYDYSEPDGYMEHYERVFLSHIIVKDRTGNRVSKFDFGYGSLETGQKKKRLLTNITEKGTTDADVLPSTNFEYWLDGNKKGKLWKVTSLLGGIVEYDYGLNELEYTNLSSMNIPGVADEDAVPFLGNNFVVLYLQEENKLRIYNWKGDEWEYEFEIGDVEIDFSNPACSSDWVTVGRDYFTVFESGSDTSPYYTSDQIHFFQWHELEDSWDNGDILVGGYFTYLTGRSFSNGYDYRRINKALKENHYPEYVVFFEGDTRSGCEVGGYETRAPVVIERRLKEGGHEEWETYGYLGWETSLYPNVEVYGAEKYFLVVTHNRAEGSPFPTTDAWVSLYWKENELWRGGLGGYFCEGNDMGCNDNPWRFGALVVQRDYFAIGWREGRQGNYNINVYSFEGSATDFDNPDKSYFFPTGINGKGPVSCTGTNDYFLCALEGSEDIYMFSKDQYGNWKEDSETIGPSLGCSFDGRYDLFAHDDYFIAAALDYSGCGNKIAVYKRNNDGTFTSIDTFQPNTGYYGIEGPAASPVRLGDEYFSLFLPDPYQMSGNNKYFFLNKIESTMGDVVFDVYSESYKSTLISWYNPFESPLANRDGFYGDTIAEDRTDFAKMIKAYRIAGTGEIQLTGLAKHYPVTKKIITDPITGDRYEYNYEFMNGRLTESMISAQYNKATVRYLNGGETVYRFFNGIEECDGCAWQSVLDGGIERSSYDGRGSITYGEPQTQEVTVDYTQDYPEKMVYGRMYEKSDYDNNGALVQQTKVNWTAYQKYSGSWFVRKTAVETLLDGVTDVTEYFYYDEPYFTHFGDPQWNNLEWIGNDDKKNGMIRKVKKHTNDKNKTTITKYDYAHEIYDDMNDKHILSEIYRTKTEGDTEWMCTTKANLCDDESFIASNTYYAPGYPEWCGDWGGWPEEQCDDICNNDTLTYNNNPCRGEEVGGCDGATTINWDGSCRDIEATPDQIGFNVQITCDCTGYGVYYDELKELGEGNMLPNPSLEEGGGYVPNNWSRFDDPDEFGGFINVEYDGLRAYEISVPQGSAGSHWYGLISDPVDVEANKQYRVSAYVKSEELVGNFFVDMHCHKSGNEQENFHYTWDNNANVRLFSSNQDWISREGTFTTASDADHCHVVLTFHKTSGSYGTVYMDSIKLAEEDNILTDSFVSYKNFGDNGAGWQPEITSSLEIDGNYISSKVNSYDNWGNILESEDGLGNRFNQMYTQDSFRKPWKNWNELSWNSPENPVSENFYYQDGMLKKIIDANGDVIEYEYDNFNRLKKVIMPYDTSSSPTLEYVYNFDSTPVSVRTIRKMDGSNKVETVQFYDGLGRGIQTQVKEDNGYIISVVKYDDSSPDNVYKGYKPFRRTDNNFGQYYQWSGDPEYFTKYVYENSPLLRVKEIYAPDSLTPIRTTYSSNNDDLRWTTVRDEKGRETTSYTNILGHLVKVENANDKLTEYEYNLIGNLLKITDTRYNNVTNTYDKIGRLLMSNHPDAGTTTYLYDNASNLIENVDGNGIKVNYYYDKINRLTNLDKDGNSLVLYNYDNDALCSSDQNSLGRSCRVEDESGSTEYEYDDRGRVTKEIKYILTNNLLENPSLEVDIDGDAVPDGWRKNPWYSSYVTLSVEARYNGAKSVKVNVLDSVNDVYPGLKSKDIPVKGGNRYKVSAYVKTLDLNGGDGFRLEMHCHRPGDEKENHRYTWDSPIGNRFLSTPNTNWTRIWGTFTTDSDVDHCNVLAIMHYQTEGVAYMDAIQLEECSSGDCSQSGFSYSYSITYSYDRSNNIRRISDPAGREVSYIYNKASQLKSVGIVGGPELADYSYNPSSTINIINFGNDVQTEYRYTPKDWLRVIRTWRIVGNELGGNFHRSYNYDQIGNLMELCSDGGDGSQWWGEGAPCNDNYDLADFGYDNLDRLTGVDNHGYYLDDDTTYQYDDAGNRKKRSIYNGVVTDYTYDLNSNKLLSAGSVTYEYDAVGNLIKKNGVPIYEYDWSNRLIKADQGIGGFDEKYVYDYKGQRVRKSSEFEIEQSQENVTYIYDQFGNLIYEDTDTVAVGVGEELVSGNLGASGVEKTPSVTGQAVKGSLKDKTVDGEETPDTIQPGEGEGGGPRIIDEPKIQEVPEAMIQEEEIGLAPLELTVRYDPVLKTNVLQWGKVSHNPITGGVVGAGYSFTFKSIIEFIRNFFRALFSQDYRFSPASDIRYLVERKVDDGTPRIYNLTCDNDPCIFADLDELADGITYDYKVKAVASNYDSGWSNQASVKYGLDIRLSSSGIECEDAGYICRPNSCLDGEVQVGYSCSIHETRVDERQVGRVLTSPQVCCAPTETYDFGNAISYIYANGNLISKLS